LLDPLIVLVPSPLVGPFSWSLVADELEDRGRQVIVSTDLSDPPNVEPAWHHATGGVVASLRWVASDRPAVIIGHSNAGPLLPVIGSSLAQPVAGYLFVDGRLPHEGISRLDALEVIDPALAADRLAALANGRVYPTWTDEDLRELIPDRARRHALLAEMRPRRPEYWTEPLPEVPAWPDAPCGYLLFSSTYRAEADRARQAGWPTRELPAGHFHLLVDPAAVADALLGLLAELPGSHYQRPNVG
jgi:hypothetical protein